MKLPQLHLRDLFWLVLVVGLVLGWGLDHQRLAGPAADAEALEALNESLVETIHRENPVAKVEITVNGRSVRKAEMWGADKK